MQTLLQHKQCEFDDSNKEKNISLSSMGDLEYVFMHMMSPRIRSAEKIWNMWPWLDDLIYIVQASLKHVLLDRTKTGSMNLTMFSYYLWGEVLIL